jgi:translation elongation factor EF-1beta
MMTVFIVVVVGNNNINAFEICGDGEKTNTNTNENNNNYCPTGNTCCRITMTTATTTTNSSSSSSSNPRRRQRRRYSREMAQTLLNTKDFLPSNKYSDRIGFGRIAVEKENNKYKNETASKNTTIPHIMTANDPRLKMTYAEFPLSSYDTLLDKAITYLSTKTKTTKTNLVDIGSGLGRIVLYTALTRGKNGKEAAEEEVEENWNISGIEIISGLHDKALQLVQTGIETGIFCSSTTAATTTTTADNLNTGTVPDNNDDCNSFSFHLGSFIENNDSKETTTIQKVLNEADLIFMYSTAFTATQFNPDPDVCALLLDGKEWSQPLSELCQNGCIVITTDKALDPYYGWKIIDRIENVPNPEVLDSTGFIHILNK